MEIRLWNKDFIYLILCVVFASFTNFSLIYMLPVHVLAIGGTNATTGLMTTGLTITYLVTALSTAPLIDRWGRKPMILLGAGLYALNAIGYVLFGSNLYAVIALRLLNGVTQGLFFPAPPTYVGDVSPREKLVDAIGFFGLAGSLAAIFSPVLGMWLYENVSSKIFFIVCAATAVISVLFAFLMEEKYIPQDAVQDAVEDENKKTKKFSLSTVLEFSIILPCLASMLIYTGNSAVNNFILPAGLARNIAGISVFLSVNNAAMCVTRLCTGRLTKIFKRNVLIIFGVILASVGTLLISFAYSLPLMLVSSALIGVGITLFTQLIQVHVLVSVPENRRGVAGSTLMLFQNIGNGLGAALFGSMTVSLGYGITYIVSAVVSAVAVPVQLIRGPHARQMKAEN